MNVMDSSSHTQLHIQLRSAAEQTLRDNDRGGYTLPTAGLYPFQWNWDASVTALGWACFEPERALQELAFLLRGQWGPQDFGGANDGLIAHIAFHTHSDTYFPGPQEWGTEALALRTSSISQPPLHATLLRWMLDLWKYEENKPLARIESAHAATKIIAIVKALVRHHRWWYRCRDPQGTGLVVNIHPWETGMDNSPAWDAPLARVPETTRAYTRKDLGHVDASMRPPKSYYDRVVYLMDLNKALGFDPARIMHECPYRVNDIGIISILQRASIDLAALCERFGMPQEAQELQTHVQRTRLAAAALWSPRWQQYVSRDTITGELLDAPTSAGLLGAYAGFDRDMSATLRQWMTETPFGLPSTRSTLPGFEAQRYWRGPVWQHINLLIADGVARAGHADLAAQIKAQSMRLYEQSSFWEYYHPITGQGLGGPRFSWTAATYLFWNSSAGH
jgi:hypothetical protein